MANAGKIEVNLVLEGGEAFVTKVTRAGKSLDTFSRNTDRASRHTRVWTGQLRDAAIVLGLARSALLNLNDILTGMPRAIINQNALLERSQMLIAGMSNEAKDYEQAMGDASATLKRLISLSSASPFKLQDISDTFAKFKAAGIEDVERSLNAMVNAAARVGATSEQMKRAGIAVQQMAGKAVVSMEELRQQLGEAIPNVMQIMADATGMRMGDMVKLISSGTMEAQTALTNMFNEMKFSSLGAAEIMAETWEGLMNRFRNTMTVLSKQIGDSGFFEEMKGIARDVIAYFNDPEFAAAAYALGEALTFTAKAAFELTKFLAENIRLLGGIAAFFTGRALLGSILGSFAAIQTGVKASVTDYNRHLTASIANVDRKIAQSQEALANAHQQTWNRMRQTVTRVSVANYQQFRATQRAMVASTQQSLNQQIAHYDQYRRAIIARTNSLSRRMIGIGRGMFNAIGGWTTLFTAAILGVIALLDQFIWKQNRAAKNLIESGGLVSNLEQFRLASAEMQELNGKINVAQENIKQLRANVEANKGGETYGLMGVEISEPEADLAEAEKKLEAMLDTRRQLARSLETANNSITEAAYNVGLSSIDSELGKKLVPLRNAYNRELDALREDLNEKGLKDEEFEAAFVPARSEARRTAAETFKAIGDARIAELEREKRALDVRIKQLLDTSAKRQLDTLNDEIASSMNGLPTSEQAELHQTLTAKVKLEYETGPSRNVRQEAAQIQGMIDKIPIKVKDLADSVGHTNQKILDMGSNTVSAGQRMEASLTKQIALYRHRLEYIQGEAKYGETLIKLNEDIATGKYADKTPEEIDAMRSKAIVLDGLIGKYKDLKDAIKAHQQASKRLANLGLDLDKQLGAAQGTSDNPFMAWAEKSKENLAAIQSVQNELIASGLMTNKDRLSLEKARGVSEKIDLQTIANQQLEFEQDLIAENRNEYEQYLHTVGEQQDHLAEVIDSLVEMQSLTEHGGEQWQAINEQILMVGDNMRMAAKEAKKLNPRVDAWYALDDTITNMANQIDDELAGAVDQVFEGFAENIVDTEYSFSEMLTNLGNQLAAFAIKMAAMNLAQSMFGGLGSLFGGGTTAPTGTLERNTPFAMGGIMTEYGSMPLKKYSTGGIATSPQVALFGEGSQNEAYVPLPDGRSIPVSMDNPAPAPVVNVINQTGIEADVEAPKMRFNGEQYIIDVVLKAAGRPGKFRNAMKGM